MGGNLLADLVQEEVRRRERIVAIDDEAVLMAPYGARLPYQLMLAAAHARARASRTTARPAPRCCTTALRRLRARLRREPAAEPLGPHRAARRRALRWRIDVVPRLTHLAGLELGTGVHLNVVAPEQVAAELRDA